MGPIDLLASMQRAELGSREGFRKYIFGKSPGEDYNSYANFFNRVKKTGILGFTVLWRMVSINHLDSSKRSIRPFFYLSVFDLSL